MKSEHRHELKTNELGRISTDFRRISERFARHHRNAIIAGAILVAVAVVGLVVWMSRAGLTEREGWRAVASASNGADFANIADKYPGTPLASWARLREAEEQLSGGVRLMFTDRDAGISDLKKAQESFERLIADKRTPRDVLERALFGLANVRESLSNKNTDSAIEIYERLLRDIPETVYKKVAEARIAALRTGTAQDFYAWFQGQHPKPADRELPKDMALPPLPDLPSDKAPTTGAGEPAGKSEAMPPAPTEKPAGSKAPSEQSPAKTGGAASPAGDKPAAKMPSSATTPAPKSSSPGPSLPAPSK